MSDSTSHPKNKLTILAQPGIWVCAGIFLYIIASLSACGGKKGDAVRSDIDSLPYTSVTKDVNSLISDSGITKYKLEAPVWYTYDKPEQEWRFPQGLVVEQFDTLFNTQASIKADTAIYHQSRKLWELIGNVEVVNREGLQFRGHSLFWDESAALVYSNEPTVIIPRDGQLIESKYGFRSNQDFTRYELYASTGHVDVEDKPLAPNDSLPEVPQPTAPPATQPKTQARTQPKARFSTSPAAQSATQPASKMKQELQPTR
ncbi:MAG: hypothetical protein Q4E10_00880 [Porphyromonas sp.]|nr:hypothetical protein [Porphyromonas sp.]